MTIKRPKRVRIDLPATVTRLIPRIKIPNLVLIKFDKLKGKLYGMSGCAALAYGISLALEGGYTQRELADAAEVRVINMRDAWQRLKSDESMMELLDSMRIARDD